MKIRHLSPIAIFIVIIFAMGQVVLARFGAYTKTDTKTFAVAAGGKLVLETDRGSIDIKTTGNDKVTIEINYKVRHSDEDEAEEIIKDFEISYDQNGSELYVNGEKKHKSHGFWGDNDHLSIDFVITVPKKFNIDVNTHGGSISVGDLDGEAKANTSGGSLTFENINGPVKGETSGGSIRLESCSGMVDINTSGGSITIGRVEGDITAHTSGGSISVEEVKGAIDASTSGGSISATISRQPKSDCRLTTSGGGIEVYLAKDINVDLDAETSAGHVETDFPVKISGRFLKSRVAAEINNGGPELYLRTSAGNIEIREL
jgi:hypothetical protein